MSVFKEYAAYYNLLYKDKDYSKEANYINDLIKLYNPASKSILNLGCGTGSHDYILINYGYDITAVDFSSDMIETAKSNNSSAIDFIEGDIREIRLAKKFDIVISLFHVMSYQITNEDLQKAFETVAYHLTPGGIFIFDCWYGPGVLTDRPTVRVKRLQDDNVNILRLAEPIIYPNDNIVDVNYSISIKDKSNILIGELKETHRMRYLFKPEVDFLAAANSFELLDLKEWLSDKKPDFNSWASTFILKKI